MKKKKAKKSTKETAIFSRVSPELLERVKKVAELRSWSLSKTTCMALESYCARMGAP